jgi:hypothetical protein
VPACRIMALPKANHIIYTSGPGVLNV